MKTTLSSSWLAPALLIALCVVPVVGGAVRLATVEMGAEVILGNDRFLAAPLPVTVHILSVSVFCILGTFQVSGPIRRRNPAWHRRAGRVLVPFGIAAALSGLWLTFVYPPGDLDGPALFVLRLFFGSAMTVFLGLGLAAIRRHNIAAHRAWMVRAFAVALGAGTQVLTHIPLSLLPDLHNEAGRAVAMGAGWIINLAVAEWIIRRRKPVRPIGAGIPARRPARSSTIFRRLAPWSRALTQVGFLLPVSHRRTTAETTPLTSPNAIKGIRRSR